MNQLTDGNKRIADRQHGKPSEEPQGSNTLIQSSERAITVSVIMPARNAEDCIATALNALFSSTYSRYEVIVVDDGSTDRTPEICSEYPCRVISVEWQGIGSAENVGAAHAEGEILYFTDADVIVPPDALERVVKTLTDHREVVALSGVYGEETPPKDFFSQYKNMLHRYVHRSNSKYTTNLFGANSAIWTHIFRDIGGFRSSQRTLEDVELGYRLIAAGHRILMAKDIEVMHCKQYNFWALIRSDVVNRAIPWTVIMLRHRHLHLDLNTRPRNLLSMLAVWSTLFTFLPVNVLYNSLWFFSCTCLFCFCNLGLLRAMYKHKGFWFALGAGFYTFFSYFYQAVGVFLGVVKYLGMPSEDRKVPTPHTTR